MSEADADLCRCLAEDLPQAFDDLVSRFQQRLFAFALRLTGNRGDAEDILQEALLGAYVSLEQYPLERIRTLQLQAWLYKVTFHAYQHSRRGARLQVLSFDDEEAALLPQIVDDAAEQPEFVLERWEQQQTLLALLAQLPERGRIALTCFYFEDLSYQEIADLLDVPLGTVKSLLHRGVRQLREALTAKREGDEPWTRILRQTNP